MWPMLDAFAAASHAALSNGVPFPTIHYLRAGNNPAWTPEVCNLNPNPNPNPNFNLNLNLNPNLNRTEQVLERFAALKHASLGGVRLHLMPNVGHWLHTENPKGMLDIMTREGV